MLSNTARVIHGINCCNSSCACLVRSCTIVSFQMTLAQTIVRASITDGLTFPGIIDDHGCTAGSESSKKPVNGQELSNLRSFPILMRSFARWVIDHEK